MNGKARKIFGVILVTVLIVLTSACQPKAQLFKVPIYFEGANGLIAEERMFMVSAAKLATSVLDELMKGPGTHGLVPTFPAGVRLLSLKIENKVAKIDLSKEFVSAKSQAYQLASIVNTLVGVQGIEKVQFLVEGVPITNFAEQSMSSILGKQDVLRVELSLYFGNSKADGLVLEKRSVVSLSPNLERLIIKEIVKGPNSSNGRATVPAPTKLLSVKVEGGVATTDFSKEIVTMHSGGSAGEAMTILSIVYSLTELPHINKVQLMLEGKVEGAMFGHGITNVPIGRIAAGLPIEAAIYSVLPKGLAVLIDKLPADISSIATGKIAGKDSIVVYSGAASTGDQLFIFMKSEGKYLQVWSGPFKRFVTAIQIADIDGDKNAEIILVGGSGNIYESRSFGYVTVLSWQKDTLVTTAAFEKGDVPLWSVAALDVTGDKVPELLVSNSNFMYVLTYIKGVGFKQLHALSAFAGTIGSCIDQSGQEYLAWRDPNGVAIGVFVFKDQKFIPAWKYTGQAEWTDGRPALGDISGDKREEYVISNLAGFFNIINADG
ncbi:MAG: GerMN domain-containing protein, partial [bacterium]|nr:GerMN domain-containing protein [bacterium]